MGKEEVLRCYGHGVWVKEGCTCERGVSWV